MYLLDTTIVSDIVNSGSSRHKAALAFIESNRLFEDQIFVSTITLGELRFGREVRPLQIPTPTQEQLEEIDRRISSAEAFSGPLEINHHVAADYARLRAAYAQGVAPRLVQAKKLKSMPPELWTQAIPASQLQITENDLWIAALAVTYEMTLVTGDKDYGRVAKHFPVLDILPIK